MWDHYRLLSIYLLMKIQQRLRRSSFLFGDALLYGGCWWQTLTGDKRWNQFKLQLHIFFPWSVFSKCAWTRYLDARRQHYVLGSWWQRRPILLPRPKSARSHQIIPDDCRFACDATILDLWFSSMSVGIQELGRAWGCREQLHAFWNPNGNYLVSYLPLTHAAFHQIKRQLDWQYLFKDWYWLDASLPRLWKRSQRVRWRVKQGFHSASPQQW